MGGAFGPCHPCDTYEGLQIIPVSPSVAFTRKPFPDNKKWKVKQPWRPSQRLPAPPLHRVCSSPAAIAARGRRQERPSAHLRWRRPGRRSPPDGTCPGCRERDRQLEKPVSRSWTPATCFSASESSFSAPRLASFFTSCPNPTFWYVVLAFQVKFLVINA